MNKQVEVFSMRALSVALLMLLLSGKAAAQTTDEMINKLVEEKNLNNSLSKKVKELEQQQKEWDKKLKDVSDSLKKVHSELLTDTVKKLNETIRNRDKTIAKLEKSLGKTDKETVDNLNEQVQTLTNVLEKAKKELEKAKEEKRDADSLITLRDTELAMLRPFREAMLRQTLETAKEWENMPFSKLETITVEKLISDCRRYGSNDKDIEKAAEKLVEMLDAMKQYSEARGRLDKPYDEAEIVAARQQLKKLKEKYKGKPQMQELVDTDDLLDGYRGGVLNFQDIISSINSALEESRGANNEMLTKKPIRDIREANKEIIEAIETIPYLNERINKYLTALENKPLEHWSGEEEIMGMLKKK